MTVFCHCTPPPTIGLMFVKTLIKDVRNSGERKKRERERKYSQGKTTVLYAFCHQKQHAVLPVGWPAPKLTLPGFRAWLCLMNSRWWVG